VKLSELVVIFQVTIESSPKDVPNGRSIVDAVREDAETSLSPLASNGSSSPLISQEETIDTNRQQETMPVVENLVAETEMGRQNGEVHRLTSSPLIPERKTEHDDTNRQEKDANVCRQNGKAAGPTSRSLLSERKTENDVKWQSRVVPSREKDMDGVRQNGDAAWPTSRPLLTERNFENGDRSRHHTVSPSSERHVPGGVVRQNGEVAVAAKRRDPSSIDRRERETQIRSIHIDDDDEYAFGEGRSVTAAETVRTSQDQLSGAQVFALNRPHARHDLAKNHHEAVVDESTFDRQVRVNACFCIYFYYS